MNASARYPLPDLESTRKLAECLACSASPPLTIALAGGLGAGKTQLVRFLAQQLGVPAEDVTSPTYVLLQRYVGQQVIYHFDFYRLDSAGQVWDLGIDELFEQPVLICIEWANKFPECLPDDCLTIEIAQPSPSLRVADLSASGEHSAKLLETLRQKLTFL